MKRRKSVRRKTYRRKTYRRKTYRRKNKRSRRKTYRKKRTNRRKILRGGAYKEPRSHQSPWPIHHNSRDPDFRTVMCGNIIATGTCGDGDYCRNAHDEEELEHYIQARKEHKRLRAPGRKFRKPSPEPEPETGTEPEPSRDAAAAAPVPSPLTLGHKKEDYTFNPLQPDYRTEKCQFVDKWCKKGDECNFAHDWDESSWYLGERAKFRERRMGSPMGKLLSSAAEEAAAARRTRLEKIPAPDCPQCPYKKKRASKGLGKWRPFCKTCIDKGRTADMSHKDFQRVRASAPTRAEVYNPGLGGHTARRPHTPTDLPPLTEFPPLHPPATQPEPQAEEQKTIDLLKSLNASRYTEESWRKQAPNHKTNRLLHEDYPTVQSLRDWVIELDYDDWRAEMGPGFVSGSGRLLKPGYGFAEGLPIYIKNKLNLKFKDGFRDEYTSSASGSKGKLPPR